MLKEPYNRLLVKRQIPMNPRDTGMRNIVYTRKHSPSPPLVYMHGTVECQSGQSTETV